MTTYTLIRDWIINSDRQQPCFRAHYPAETLALVARGARSADKCQAALRAARPKFSSLTTVAIWRRTLVVARFPRLKPMWRVLGHVDDVQAWGPTTGRPSLKLAVASLNGVAWARGGLRRS